MGDDDSSSSLSSGSPLLAPLVAKGDAFFVTVGKGLEREASLEIQERLGGELIQNTHAAGKLFFVLPSSSLNNLQLLKHLKSVERVFVLVLCQPPDQFGNVNILILKALIPK